MNKIAVIRTNYSKTISYLPWRYYEIKAADSVEIYDLNSNELLSVMNPQELLMTARRVRLRDDYTGEMVMSDYFVADYIPGNSYCPPPKQVKVILRRKVTP